ncbi:hypothetical protein SAMN02745166_01904 [Prosthecobacter debontii]|uniref:OB-fold nucleic acid binding domain-containing protein n=1 Tax=Prosthecobacter debontii TaxID=48467 RepID=A0A1T4XSE0_9BACT|nr:hypothetical protein SAMN02745166_01904 [Prosthecobacter debontii]
MEANFGLATTVVGKVKRVATLGSSGHKLMEFEGTDFNIAINRRQAEQLGSCFDGLPGKTVQIKGKISKYNESCKLRSTLHLN